MGGYGPSLGGVHGASAAGAPLWVIAAGLAVFMFIALKSGAFSLTDRTIDCREQPARYWGLMGVLAAALVALIIVGWIANTHLPVHVTSGGG